MSPFAGSVGLRGQFSLRKKEITMFIVKKQTGKTITWPCVVETAADGGKIQKFEFTGSFLILDDDAKEAIDVERKAADAEAARTADADSVDVGTGNEWKDRSIDLIMKIMTGWSGVVDENKTPLEFNRDTLRAAARGPSGVSVLRAINTAIAEIGTGARQKN